MIKVVFHKGEIVASGHAEFGEYGSDIVCSAVSALLQNLAYVLREFGADFEKDGGYLRIWNIPDDECTKKYLKVTLRVLEEIHKKYPKNLYVEVK